jgi:hypothetical protein
MAKILREDSPFGQKLIQIEKLFIDLNIELMVESENIILIDNDSKTKVRLATGVGIRDGSYSFPRRFDDERFYSLEE